MEKLKIFRFSERVMMCVCLVLSILSIVLACLLYGSYRNVEKLKKDKSLQRMEADIVSILSPMEPRVSISLNCHTIYIKEHFGKNFKWGISVSGMNYEMGENYIMLRNDNKGVGKSWFPKSEEHEKGGVGRSVLVREKEYKLELPDGDRAIKIISRFDAIKSLCS